MSFKTLDPQDFLISADSITAPCWTNYSPSLDRMFTSSVQITGTSGNYYLNIYNANPATTSSAQIQFNITYGNKFGSGSLLYDPGVDGLSPTRTVYGQFRNLIYGDENTDFVFGSGVGAVTPTRQDFYAITIDRARYKESLLPGSLNLTLFSGSAEMYLTDDSSTTSTISYCDAGRIYQVVSGSGGVPIAGGGYTANSGSYGLFLPDIGTIILNASALDLTYANGGINLGTKRNSNSNDDNPIRLYQTQSVIGLQSGSVSSFQLNCQETVTSDYVFVRARNGEFNYSSNPSFISGSTGAILYDLFINNPSTYITTIGLYNDSNELLAVAKLSKPLKKDFTKEALVRVKLDF
jgi:hypothetical protein